MLKSVINSITIIIIIITVIISYQQRGKARNEGTIKSSRIGHCTNTLECTYVGRFHTVLGHEGP
jgi:hypothetical protein